jgi:DNA polymerase
MERVASEVSGCTRCRLSETRNNTVPGEGPPDPLVMCIGEGPGADEDRTGRPFVGRAGQYLDKWLTAVDLDRRTNTYIANIVKCRPPGNRDPLEDEADACLPYLRRQIALLGPSYILTLGRVASQILTGRTEGIGSLRGGTYEFLGVPLIPTYHPSGVLRNPELRAPVWEDLKRLKALLDADLARTDLAGRDEAEGPNS